MPEERLSREFGGDRYARARSWLAEETGEEVALDYLIHDEPDDEVWHAMARVGSGAWEWTTVPSAVVDPPTDSGP